MAVKTFTITFQWENGSAFQMTTREGDDPAVTDIKITENGAIGVIWPGAQSACLMRINNRLTSIGEEMKT